MKHKPLDLHPKADIPNHEGFKLTVVTLDGDLIRAVVIKLQNGTHRLQNVAIEDVRGWMPR